MDELMKETEDHLAKGRVQIATDEAVHNIKRDELPAEFERMQWVFRQILGSLPEKRDWLDPTLEKEMKLYGTAALSSNAAQSAGQEPVAVVCECFEIRWAGSGPIAPIVERNGIKVGTKLYTHPSPAPAVAGEAWLPIASAPNDRQCIVAWLEDGEWRYAFEYKEDDVWNDWANHYEHFCVIAKPEGSIGPKQTPPYTHYKELAAPSQGEE